MIKIAYVNVPKDILKIREKWFFNLTKRESITLILSGILGYSSYLFLKQYISTNALYISFISFIIFMLILFLGLYNDDDGIFLEDKIINYIYFLKSKKIKVYKSENFYSKINTNELIDKEIKRYKKSNERS